MCTLCIPVSYACREWHALDNVCTLKYIFDSELLDGCALSGVAKLTQHVSFSDWLCLILALCVCACTCTYI